VGQGGILDGRDPAPGRRANVVDRGIQAVDIFFREAAPSENCSGKVVFREMEDDHQPRRKTKREKDFRRVAIAHVIILLCIDRITSPCLSVRLRTARRDRPRARARPEAVTPPSGEAEPVRPAPTWICRDQTPSHRRSKTHLPDQPRKTILHHVTFSPMQPAWHRCISPESSHVHLLARESQPVGRIRPGLHCTLTPATKAAHRPFSYRDRDHPWMILGTPLRCRL
jgi:hypothetical protein